jgi:dephospho-CoA kinase
MNFSNKSIDIVAKNAEMILTPTQCLQEIVAAYTEYKKIAEEEKTKREQIKAWKVVEVEKINTLKNFLREYLDNSFDERKDNFEKMFALLDVAISNNNNEQLALILNSITDLAKTNPFKQLSNLDSVREALNNSNHVWEF